MNESVERPSSANPPAAIDTANLVLCASSMTLTADSSDSAVSISAGEGLAEAGQLIDADDLLGADDPLGADNLFDADGVLDGPVEADGLVDADGEVGAAVDAEGEVEVPLAAPEAIAALEALMFGVEDEILAEDAEALAAESGETGSGETGAESGETGTETGAGEGEADAVASAWHVGVGGSRLGGLFPQVSDYDLVSSLNLHAVRGAQDALLLTRIAVLFRRPRMTPLPVDDLGPSGKPGSGPPRGRGKEARQARLQ